MSKKNKFIEEIKNKIASSGKDSKQFFTSEDALDYWNSLQLSGDNEKPRFTDNGKLVLSYMQEHKEDFNNLFKAKDIGEGLSISSRTASGALRKLVSDGYVERMGESPVVYSLTKEGIEINPNAEED